MEETSHPLQEDPKVDNFAGGATSQYLPMETNVPTTDGPDQQMLTEDIPQPTSPGGFAVDEESGLGVRKIVEEVTAQADLNLVEAAMNAEGPSAEELANAIIEEAAAAVSQQPISEEPAAPPLTTEEPPAPGAAERASEKPAPKKKPSKPVKKVLVAKKESDLAVNFLNGKHDLADVLPEKDCLFLASQFWVFTHEQLRFLIRRASEEEPSLEDGEAQKYLTRDQVLAKIAASDILNPKTQTDVCVKMEDEETPVQPEVNVDSMDIDEKKGIQKDDSGEAGKDEQAASDTQDSAGDSGTSNEALRSTAEARLRQWTEMLDQAKDKPRYTIEERFALSGGVSTLLTPTTLNFLGTVDIKTLLSFLALKKTETGAICDFFLTWRKKCGLAPLTHLGVAKYLLGVNARIESALSSIPPVDEDKRHWMMDPIIVMTGAAREFLVDDQKILTAFDFVHTRTKDLSLALAAWRQRKGFVPLKGSGKVAMISGWKATAKEVLEVEAGVGKVLEGDDTEGLVLADIPGVPSDGAPSPPKKQSTSDPAKPVRAVISHALMEPIAVKAEGPHTPVHVAARHSMENTKKRINSTRRQSEYDLHSKLFLDEILGEEETDVLAASHIHTAAQLFEANEETRTLLADKIAAAELVDEVEEAEALIEQWIISLKELLDLDLTDQYAPPKKKAKSSEKKKSISSEKNESSSSAKSKKTKSHHKMLKPEQTQNVNDPFELLSAVTKKFLNNIGITSAEQFLTARTTDIATEFVTFRKNEGMPELKGLGSIASVSGWKANCRKYCKNLGWDEVADMEPPDKFVPTKADPGLKQIKEKSTPKKTARGEAADDNDVPFSKQRRVFGVQGNKDLPLQFRFDLSLRASMEPSVREKDIFLTFKGSSPRSSQEGPQPATEYATVDVGGVVENLPILQDTLLARSNDRSVDFRATFESSRTGGGLVELSKHGARPLANQDLAIVKNKVRSFVTALPADSDVLARAKTSNRSNVVVRLTSFEDCQYLFCVGHPLEAGQTVPVSFPSVHNVLRSNRFEERQCRNQHLLVEAFHVLSRNDVRLLIGFLVEEMEKVGLKKLLEDVSDEYEISLELKTKLISSIRARFKIHWLCRHLFRLAPARTADEEHQRESLYFGCHLPSIGKALSPELSEIIRSAMVEEFRSGILSLLELDCICGVSQRKGWCPVVSEFFEGLVAAVTMFESDYPANIKKFLVKKYEEISTMEFKEDGDNKSWTFKVSPLGTNPRLGEKDVVICSAKGGKVVEVKLSEFKDNGAKLAVDWYKSFLLQVQYKIIHVCGFLLSENDFSYEDLLGYMKPLKDEELSGVEYGSPAAEEFPYTADRLALDLYQPHSYQFFLGIVWPTLSEFGWRIQVVEFPSKIKYIAPQWKGEHQKQGKLAKLAKQQRDRRRSDLARAANQLGLGALPKLSKRLFLASKPSPKDGGASSSEKKTRSTKKVADIAQLFLKETFADDGRSINDRAHEVVELVLDCFDKAGRPLCTEVNALELDESQLPRYSCSADIFMQFLLVLPSLLTQSRLELQEINDSLQVVQDLTAFCRERCDGIFPPAILPPIEIYTVKEKHSTPFMVQRLHQASRLNGSGEGGYHELVEVIWEEDKKDLSDFVVTVMEQVVACRATEEDARRKHRKITVGYPGAVCRHCMGQNGEGRYFFTTIESLTTLGTVFEKHFAKCSHVPSQIKKAIVTNKARHLEQRKHLPSGSQQAYFLKLWDRLRTMRISGEGSNSRGTIPISQHPTYASDGKAKEESFADAAAEQETKLEFDSQLQVLDYVRNTAPWKGTKEIDGSLNQYYTCIDFGGRIYNTRGMPKHFSPSWLLGKVGPKQTKKKHKNLPG